MKDIELRLHAEQLHPGAEFGGTVRVNFAGRYDGIVVNTQVLDSNELVRFRSYNEKRTSSVARLFVGREAMPQNEVGFTAALDFEPDREYEVKFRASIIEQHKEIESVIVFARYLSP